MLGGRNVILRISDISGGSLVGVGVDIGVFWVLSAIDDDGVALL
jgi:hypothetical protein